jgi:hypothetical protein
MRAASAEPDSIASKSMVAPAAANINLRMVYGFSVRFVSIVFLVCNKDFSISVSATLATGRSRYIDPCQRVAFFQRMASFDLGKGDQGRANKPLIKRSQSE